MLQRLGTKASIFLATSAVLWVSLALAHEFFVPRLRSGEVQDAYWGLAVFGLVVSALVAWIAAAVGSRAARRLTRIAANMSSGDLSARSGASGDDEFASLGRALDKLAASLSDTLSELRSERDRLDRVLSSMREGVLLVDSEGRVQLVNDALVEMLYLPPNTIGKLAREMLEPPELSDLLELARSGGSPTAELTLSKFPVRTVLARARRLPRGNGVVGVLVDITEQRRLETVRSEFVANASHELRTPIAAILSAVETLQSLATDQRDTERGFIDMINRNAQRLQALVDDLLTLSHIESGAIQVDLEPIPLKGVIESLMNDFAPAARRRHTQLVRLVPSNAVALANQRGLQHTIGNLIDNAIKYSPEGSKVTVEVRQENGTVTIDVKDDGPGIPPEHRARVFERFYRVDAGRSRAVGGTGLGLAIVKHWVEAMGGGVRVLAGEPRGSVFRVSLDAPMTEE